MIIPTSELLTVQNMADNSSSDKSAVMSPLWSLRPAGVNVDVDTDDSGRGPGGGAAFAFASAAASEVWVWS